MREVSSHRWRNSPDRDDQRGDGEGAAEGLTDLGPPGPPDRAPAPAGGDRGHDDGRGQHQHRGDDVPLGAVGCAGQLVHRERHPGEQPGHPQQGAREHVAVAAAREQQAAAGEEHQGGGTDPVELEVGREQQLGYGDRDDGEHRGAGRVDDVRPADQQLPHAGLGDDHPATSAGRAVARRPGGDRELLEVDQHLVGDVDRERRHGPGGDEGEQDHRGPGDLRPEAGQQRPARDEEDTEPGGDPDVLHLAGAGPGGAGSTGGHGGTEAGDADQQRQAVGSGLPRDGVRRGSGERGSGGRAVGGVPAGGNDAEDGREQQEADGDLAQGVVGAGGEDAGEDGCDGGQRAPGRGAGTGARLAGHASRCGGGGGTRERAERRDQQLTGLDPDAVEADLPGQHAPGRRDQCRSLGDPALGGVLAGDVGDGGADRYHEVQGTERPVHGHRHRVRGRRSRHGRPPSWSCGQGSTTTSDGPTPSP